MNSFTPEQIATLTTAWLAALKSIGVVTDTQINVANYNTFAVFAPVVTPPPAGTTYYVNSSTGDDSHLGTTPATAFKTIRSISNATVYLSGSFTDATLDLSGKVNAIVTGNPSAKPTIQVGAGGGVVVRSDDTTASCMLSNVILDSADGKGIGWNIHGSKLTIQNVDLKNLGDALRMVNTPGLTLIGGKQVGNVTGRCVFVTNWNGGAWTGGEFGPSQAQSPVRCSSDPTAANNGGLQNVTVDGLSITQVGSGFPIACGAFHRAINCKLNNITVNGGEFSFDSAGAGEQDAVTGCTITNLKTINTKFNIGAVASNCTVSGGTFNNPTGECISLSAGSNIVIDGVTMYSPKHGAHAYSASNFVLKNSVLHGPVGTPIVDGNVTAANSVNNKLVTP